MLAKTSFVPKDFAGNGGAVLAAIQYGHEVGLPPMASLQSICVINGRPSVFGDGYWAIILAHPLCEWANDDVDPSEILQKGYAQVTIKRRGNPRPITRKYTREMAEKAGLWGKAGVWQNYPAIMLMWRARHLAGSAALPEATKGLIPAAIARDVDIDPADVRREEEKPIAIPQLKPQEQAEEKRKGRPVGSKNKPKGEADAQQETDSGSHDVGPAQQPAVGGGSGGGNPQDAGDNNSLPAEGTGPEAPKTPTLAKPWENKDLPLNKRVELWIENADKDELNSRPNFLSFSLSKLDVNDQAELCKKYDLRRRET
jgi:hypothetical protein